MNMLLEKAGKKPSDLIRDTGLPKGRVYSWLQRESIPTVEDAYVISKYFGVSVEYLVTGKDSGDPWLSEHAELLRDLKDLTPEDLSVTKRQVAALATEARTKRKLASNL